LSVPFKALDLRWSPNGKRLLVSGKQQFIVLAPFSTGHDVILDFTAGAEGMAMGSSPHWIDDQVVLHFSADVLLATLLSIESGRATVVANPRHARCFVSPSREMVALLVRRDCTDVVLVFSAGRLAHESDPLIAFPTRTNDASSVHWSPDERFIAVKEGSLEYKVHVFSVFGHLQATLAIESDEQTMSSGIEAGTSATVAGGLGVRDVQWSPDGRWLALSDFKDHVRFVETRRWTQCRTAFDLTSLAASPSSSHLPVHAFRETSDWRAKTGGRSIVPLDAVALPLALPRIQYDVDGKSLAKIGVCWMDWCSDATFFAMRCASVPNAVFIVSTMPSTPPRLSSIIVFHAPITDVCWRKAGTHDELIVVCGTPAVFVWRKTASLEYMAEAIPVPIGEYAPDRLTLQHY
jgi:hypothetical protein